MLWSFYWLATVAETPASDGRISKDELDYIQTNIGYTVDQAGVCFNHCAIVLI